MLSYSIIRILMYHYYSTLLLKFYWSSYNQWYTLQLINRTTSLLYMWKLSSYKNLIWSQILILWELWRACKCMEFSIHFRCSIWPHFKCSFSENLINDVRLKAANSNRCFNWPLKIWRVVICPELGRSIKEDGSGAFLVSVSPRFHYSTLYISVLANIISYLRPINFTWFTISYFR